MSIRISLALAAVLFWTNTGLLAQTATPTKFGHMNFGNLLEELPESKKANETLTAFAKTFTVKGDSLGNKLQADATEFQRKYDEGAYTPVEAQKRYQELQQQQAELEAFEKDAQEKVAAKRDEMLNPILKKLDDAIKAVGKENGYAMIFDVGSGAALYAAESEDVTALVKKKLGM